MDVITLEAQTREVGKRAARAARRDGNVPCVLYGSQVEGTPFQVPEPVLKPLIYTNETHLVQIDLDGQSWECVLKDISFHPVTDRPMHVDFQVLQQGEKITLTAPVRYLGTPIGQTEGGNTTFVISELEISCLPKDIPSHIDVDVSQLQIGDAIHIGDLEIEGVEILNRPEQTLVTVVPPRAMTDAELEEESGLLLEDEEEFDGEASDEASDEDED